jgi:hypothetical protein
MVAILMEGSATLQPVVSPAHRSQRCHPEVGRHMHWCHIGAKAAKRSPDMSPDMTALPNIVLVHGAWADG